MEPPDGRCPSGAARPLAGTSATGVRSGVGAQTLADTLSFCAVWRTSAPPPDLLEPRYSETIAAERRSGPPSPARERWRRISCLRRSKRRRLAELALSRFTRRDRAPRDRCSPPIWPVGSRQKQAGDHHWGRVSLPAPHGVDRCRHVKAGRGRWRTAHLRADRDRRRAPGRFAGPGQGRRRTPPPLS